MSTAPDIILHRGLFTTLDRANPTASAVAIAAPSTPIRRARTNRLQSRILSRLSTICSAMAMTVRCVPSSQPSTT